MMNSRLSWRRVSKALLVIFLISLPLISGIMSWQAYRGDIRRVIRFPLVPYRDIATTAVDGLEVNGWLLGEGSCGAVVVVPGWGQGRGTQLETAEDLARANYQVVVYDPRGGTGQSTYGTREQFDVRAVLDWLVSQDIPVANTVLLGHSMGGVAAQLVAADTALAGVVLESSVYDVRDTRRQVAREYRLLFPAVYAAVAAVYDNYMWGVPTPDLKTTRSKINAPVLLLHTAEDAKARLSTAIEAQQQLRDAQLTVLSGGHRAFLDNEASRVQSVAIVKTFLAEKLPKCLAPSSEGVGE